MNLEQTLAHRGVIGTVNSVSKSEDMVAEHLMSDDPTSLDASFGIANDSFHFGLLDIVPPKNTVPVANPGDAIDKKNRKSKKFRKYEQELQRVQDSGPRRTLVQTTAFDNSDIIDITRSAWFV